jgi:hypothetical protein
MRKIDARKNQQWFKSRILTNVRIYVHKLSNGMFAVGINGTSNHYTNKTKQEAEDLLNLL